MNEKSVWITIVGLEVHATKALAEAEVARQRARFIAAWSEEFFRSEEPERRADGWHASYSILTDLSADQDE